MADAIAAIPELTGEPDGPPMPTTVPLADNTAALLAVGMICAALYGRVASGCGTYIDLSLLDAAFGIHDLGIQTYISTNGATRMTRRGLHDDMRVPWGYFKAADGWVCIMCGTEPMWATLAEAIGRADMLADPRYDTADMRRRNPDGVYAAIEAWVSSMPSAEEVVRLLSDLKIPCARVNDIKQAIEDPQVEARQLIIERAHPVLGEVKLQNFLGVNLSPDAVLRPAPLLGEHNREIALELAGLSDSQYQALVGEGCLYEHRRRPRG